MDDKRLKLNRQMRQKFDRINRLSQVQSMDPIEFEQYVGYLYQKEGYRVALTVTSGDEGVDLFLRRGLSTAVVQCKRYSGTVGQPTVRDLYGAMVHNKARRAMLVTSGSISQPAEDWAKGKPIDLIDGHELMSWAKRSRGMNTGSLKALGSWGIALIGLVLLVGVLYWGVGQVSRLSESLPTAVTPDNPEFPFPIMVHVTALQQGIINRQIEVDGDISEWKGITPYPLAYRLSEEPDWDGSDDLGVTWQLAWNGSRLWVAVAVTDDKIVPTAADSKQINGDALLLLLDTQEIEHDRLNQNSYQLSLLPGNLDATLPSVRIERGNQGGGLAVVAGDGIQIAVQPTDDGYNLEASIPWQVLQVIPKGELTMGLVLGARDNDKNETAVPQVVYAHSPNSQTDDPTTWGKMILDTGGP